MQASTVTREDLNLAYETKVVLSAIASILIKAESIEEAYLHVQKMANAEGLVLQPFKEMKSEFEALKNQDTEK